MTMMTKKKTSETISVDMSAEEISDLVKLYITSHLSEATNDLIKDEFPDGITPGNFNEAAGMSLMNEMIIKILENEISARSQEKT